MENYLCITLYNTIDLEHKSNIRIRKATIAFSLMTKERINREILFKIEFKF